MSVKVHSTRDDAVWVPVAQKLMKPNVELQEASSMGQQMDVDWPHLSSWRNGRLFE